jgi:hypothetical protein
MKNNHRIFTLIKEIEISYLNSIKSLKKLKNIRKGVLFQ